MELINRNINNLKQTRQAYLNKKTNKINLLADFAWIGLGMLLIGGAAAMTIAAPFLIIPGLIIGAATFSYGVFDLAKELTEVYNESKHQELGERDLSKNQIDKLQNDFKEFDIKKLLSKNKQNQLQSSKEKKLIKSLSITASTAGFALGAVALVAIIPSIAFPPVAAIVIAAVSCAVIVSALAILGVKTYRAIKEVKTLKSNLSQKTDSDKETFTSLCQQENKHLNKNSTALIFEQEMKASHRAIAKESHDDQKEKSIQKTADHTKNNALNVTKSTKKTSEEESGSEGDSKTSSNDDTLQESTEDETGDSKNKGLHR